MENNINASCAICGKGYHVCQSCLNMKTIKPWRTVTDTIAHYKIYFAIHEYTLTKDKTVAREELTKCDLTGLDEFIPEIKDIIREIMYEPNRDRPQNKKNQDNKNNPVDKSETAERKMER